MALRDTINKKPVIGFAFAGVAVIIAVVLIIWLVGGGSFGQPVPPLPKRFYTIDDGKTYYPDTIDRLPPYNTPEGKVALRAMVVRCGKGEPYVAYVEKYSEKEKKRLEALFSDVKQRVVAIESIMGPQDYPVVKKAQTGDTGWVDSKSGDRYDAIVQVACPGGGGLAQPVFPGK